MSTFDCNMMTIGVETYVRVIFVGASGMIICYIWVPNLNVTRLRDILLNCTSVDGHFSNKTCIQAEVDCIGYSFKCQFYS